MRTKLKQDAPEEAAALQAVVVELTGYCCQSRCAYFLVDSSDRDLLAWAHMMLDETASADTWHGRDESRRRRPAGVADGTSAHADVSESARSHAYEP